VERVVVEFVRPLNKGRPPNVAALQEIARHARRVLW
jgi:hypothetical protein